MAEDEINPHIPQYISKAPWYLTEEKARTLSHQRYDGDESSTQEWYRRGGNFGPAPKKFRKGACTNCGAMTHSVKLCLERPRARSAKFTKEQLQPDERLAVNPKLDFDAKRDRYGGFHPEEFREMIRHAEVVEQARQQRPVENADKEEFVSETAVGLSATATRSIVNLRIREDTAKYLYNLDPNSAFYDPKSRSMRDNPLQHLGAGMNALTSYQGDNVARTTGEVAEIAAREAFAWEAYKHSAAVHTQAQPTQMELLFKEQNKKRSALQAERQKALHERYAPAAGSASPSEQFSV